MMTGIDLLLIVLVAALLACIHRQRRIDRHNQQRDETRRVISRILRATGQIR